MARRPLVLTLAALTLVLCWATGLTVRSNFFPLAQAQSGAKEAERTTVEISRKPVRIIGEDPYSNFGGVAVDEERGEVFLSNDNDMKGASIETYHAEFPPEQSEHVTEPLRTITGPKAELGDICGITLSPEFNELFKVNGDGNGDLGVFPIDASGNVEPIRSIPTSHGAWGVFMDRKFDELFITIEHVNRIEVYNRTVQLTGGPTRFIQGPATQLADPHGIYTDVDRNEIYVVNHGNWHLTQPGETFLQEGSIPPELKGKRKSYFDNIRELLPSTGKFLPPSITVYSRTANGDVKPLRVIQGEKTTFDIPLGMVFDAASNQLAVANAGGDSILFFDVNGNGDVAPARVLKGAKTGLAGPSSLTIDKKRNELWVANWNNHTATVYARTASGDVAPLRTLRAAPKGTPAAGLGRPGTVAFDPKRKEILVPN